MEDGVDFGPSGMLRKELREVPSDEKERRRFVDTLTLPPRILYETTLKVVERTQTVGTPRT